MRTFGLIPAAGKSTRMGQPKLLLPLGETTVLEQVVTAVRAAGVAEVLVVVGPHGDALVPLAERAGALVLRLDHETGDMRATCQAGLDWLEAHSDPRPDDGWLLLPADHPTVRADVVRALLDEAARRPEASVVVPAYRGRRGHPAWLRWRHVADVRAVPEGQGLNHFIRQQGAALVQLDWPGDEVLRDLDTPEDYRRLLEGK